MNLKYRFSTILMSSLLLASGLFVAACGDDDLDNMQTSVNGVTLKSFGPCPLTRGESMEVIGVNLGKVSKVLFPKGNQRLYDTKTYEEAQFSLNTDGKLSVTVPDEVVPVNFALWWVRILSFPTALSALKKRVSLKMWNFHPLMCGQGI